MVKAVFDELKTSSAEKSFHHRHSGRRDPHQPRLRSRRFRRKIRGPCARIFYGLGSDGTVGANKNSIKIIGENTPNHAQGYFVYDSKKAGSVTISHLRFGPRPIESTYLITQASFVACHQFSFLERMDVLAAAEPGATFLLNSPFAADQVWDQLPRKVQQQIVEKKLQVLRHRRIFRRAPGGNGQPHQHDHANLLLRHQRRAAARGSHRRHQARDPENLRQARRSRRAEKFRRRGCVHRSLARSESAARGRAATSIFCRRCRRSRPAFVRERSRRNDFRQRRFASGERHAAGRHVSHRHFQMGKAKHRAANSRLGRRPLHSVRKMRAGLPARRHPREGLRFRRCLPARPRNSNPRSPAGGILPTSATRSRSRRKIAPAAASAWKFARQRARAK